jgi:hypothetical protein
MLPACGRRRREQQRGRKRRATPTRAARRARVCGPRSRHVVLVGELERGRARGEAGAADQDLRLPPATKVLPWMPKQLLAFGPTVTAMLPASRWSSPNSMVALIPTFQAVQPDEVEPSQFSAFLLTFMPMPEVELPWQCEALPMQ